MGHGAYSVVEEGVVTGFDEYVFWSWLVRLWGPIMLARTAHKDES